jgi:hypothetical protein
MKKPIEINGETWYYEVYKNIDYDWYYVDTAFFKTKTKTVTKRKFWLFGEKSQVEVEKSFGDADFKLPFSINDPKYTKAEIQEKIQIKLERLNRIDEIKRGEII